MAPRSIVEMYRILLHRLFAMASTPGLLPGVFFLRVALAVAVFPFHLLSREMFSDALALEARQ
jgi:hypothetical protein